MFELVEAKPNIFYFMCIFYYKIYNTCDLRFEKNASILFILFIDFFFFCWVRERLKCSQMLWRKADNTLKGLLRFSRMIWSNINLSGEVG